MKKISQLMLILSIVLLSTNYLLYHCFNNYNIKTEVRIVSILLALLSILLSGKIIAKAKYVIVLLLLTIGAAIGSEIVINILTIMLMVYALNATMSKKNIPTVLSIASSVPILLFIFLRHIGLIKDTITTYGGRYRNALGFDNPNALSVIIIGFCCMWICTRKSRKSKIFSSLLSLLLTIIVTEYTGSRTLLISMIIFITLIISMEIKSVAKIIRRISSNTVIKNTVLILLFMSPFIVSYITSGNPKIDALLSYRGSIINNYIEEQSPLAYIYGLTKTAPIDNSFIMLFFSFGIIGYIFIYRTIYRSTNNETITNNELAIILTMLLYGTMEGLLIRPESTIVIYFWYIVLHNSGYLNGYISDDKK